MSRGIWRYSDLHNADWLECRRMWPPALLLWVHLRRGVALMLGGGKGRSAAMTDRGSSVRWRRSQQCQQNVCVEVAWDATVVLVRDSKDPEGGTLRFTPREWEAFLAGVRHGDFDLPDPAVPDAG